MRKRGAAIGRSPKVPYSIAAPVGDAIHQRLAPCAIARLCMDAN